MSRQMTGWPGRLAVAAATALTLAACGAQQSSVQQAKAQPGVTKDTITIGATYPLSGSATAYAALAVGANAYFQHVNDEGGVHGRKIKYVVLDDQYLPANTPAKARELIQVQKVFATFGNLGSPTNAAVRPYYNQEKVPQLFVFTGNTLWGSQFNKYPWTVGWQPDYQSEAKLYARYILQNDPGAKIGVLYQNDVYGQDYLTGFKSGLGAKADSMIVKTATYNAGDPVNMSSQVATLKSSGADTFFVVTTPAYSASALVETAKQGWKPHLFINDVGADSLTMTKVAQSLGSSAALDGAISSQYAKDPNDPQWASDKGMQLYKQILGKYPSSYGFTCQAQNLFCIVGMAFAYTTVDVLKQAGQNPTRDRVREIATSALNETDNPFLLPGIAVHTTKSDHFPIRQERLQRWESSRWVPFGEIMNGRT
jgi:branched-chain amino acid transport system substrate-binding protein